MRLWHKRFGESITCIRQADDADPSPSSPSPAPVPQFADSPLPAAMLAVAHHDSPENRRVLYESMFKTWFLVPTRETPVPETPSFHDIQEDTAASFSLEHDSAGQLVAVAFTDEEALRNWNKSIPWIALQGTAFFQAVLSTQAEEIVINPFEPENPASRMIRPGGRVTRWEFEALAQGRHPSDESTEEQAAAAKSMLVTMPKHMPSAEIFKALATAAKAFPEVIGIYFAQLIYPTGHPHRALAVEFAPDTAYERIEPAMDALEREAKKLFPRKETTDLFLASSATGQSIANSGEKFYTSAK